MSREEMSDSQNSRKLYHLLSPQKHINDRQNFAVVTQIIYKFFCSHVHPFSILKQLKKIVTQHKNFKSHICHI